MLTLDTSALVALLDSEDPYHARAVEALAAEAGPHLVPAGILAEVAYFLQTRLGTDVLAAFIEDLETGAFAFECGEQDLPRLRHLVDRYADLRLGFADACVIACAERNGGRVMTFDRRDFDVVSREGMIQPIP